MSARQIAQRPIYRSGEVYESVPGVVVSQHSGDGKANQYYVRGFNIDHGTDLATSVAGVPVNMPTHAHGQGYSDNNFLIPELVSGVQYQKGTYDATEGDFSAAGNINVNYLNVLDRPLVKLEGGAGPLRARALRAPPRAWARGHLLYAGGGVPRRRALGEPGRPPQVERRAPLLAGRPAERLQPDRHRLQRPLELHRPDPPTGRRRAASSTASARSTRSDAGETHRFTLAGEWRHSTRAGPDPGQGLRHRLRPRPVLELHVLPRRPGERRPVRAEGRAHGPGRVGQPAVPEPLVRPGRGERGRAPGPPRPHPHRRPVPHREAAAPGDDPRGRRDAVERLGLLPDQHPVVAPSCARRRGCGATRTTST